MCISYILFCYIWSVADSCLYDVKDIVLCKLLTPFSTLQYIHFSEIIAGKQ